MSRGINKVILVGNVGQDPEIRHSQSGTPVATTSVATTEKWTDQTGNQQERTEWHNIVAFGKTAEIMEQYVQKGTKLYLEGKLQTQEFEKEGQTHYRTKIIVNNFLMLGDTGGQQDDAPARPKKAAKPKPKTEPKPDFVDDDIPF